MITILVTALLLTASLADIVPCSVPDPSSLATVSDCSAKKLDSYALQWGARITFTGSADHREDNWRNLLADNVHPRLPYFPLGGYC
jgi:hypothetical protein